MVDVRTFLLCVITLYSWILENDFVLFNFLDVTLKFRGFSLFKFVLLKHYFI
jgi:hypothetical protein